MCAQKIISRVTKSSHARSLLIVVLLGQLCARSAVAQQASPTQAFRSETDSAPILHDTRGRVDESSASDDAAFGVQNTARDRLRSRRPVPPDPDQDVRMGVVTTQYIDPEFSSAERRAVYQTGGGTVWIGDIDPITGLFRSETGKDYLMDRGAVPLATTMQGPEWGRDANGFSVYYTKLHNFVLQHYRATLVDGVSVTQRLTSGIVPRRTIMASSNSQSDSVKLLYLRGIAGLFSWSAMDESSPGVEMVIPEVHGGVSGPRWVPGSDDFVYLTDVDGNKQIAITSAVDGRTDILTNDDTEKVEVFPFRAPEFNNEMLLLANIDCSHIAIYRDTGGAYFERILTIDPPEDAEHKYMFSIEPLAAAGRTYFVLEMHKSRGLYLSIDSSIWIFDMNADPQTRLARRLDDGTSAYRLEAECLTGSDEIFVYYSTINILGRWELRRTRTGIRPQNPAVPADLDGDGDVDDDDADTLIECAGDSLSDDERAACAAADLDGDAEVNDLDLQILEACWTGPYGTVSDDCVN